MDDRGEIRSARGYGDTEVLGARWLASQPRGGSESTGIPRAQTPPAGRSVVLSRTTRRRRPKTITRHDLLFLLHLAYLLTCRLLPFGFLPFLSFPIFLFFSLNSYLLKVCQTLHNVSPFIFAIILSAFHFNSETASVIVFLKVYEVFHLWNKFHILLFCSEFSSHCSVTFVIYASAEKYVDTCLSLTECNLVRELRIGDSA